MSDIDNVRVKGVDPAAPTGEGTNITRKSDGVLILPQRLDVSAAIPSHPDNICDYYDLYLQNGASKDMTVDGSVTAVDFQFTLAGALIYYVDSLTIFMNDPGTATAANFGSLGAPLTNGVQIDAQQAGTTGLINIQNIQSNIDLAQVFAIDGAPGLVTGGFFDSGDYFLGRLKFPVPLVLYGAFTDFFRVRIRDDLTGITDFQAMIHGWVRR